MFKFILMILVVCLAGCTTTAPRKVKPSAGQFKSLKQICAQNNIRYSWDNIAQIVTLKKDDLEARLLVNSEIVLVNDISVVLSGPVRMDNSVLVVPADFNEKVLTGAVKKPAVPAKEKRPFKIVQEVILDAGHGGKDPGAIGISGSKEKDIVLDITKEIKAILEKHGIKVQLTRAADEFISLNERTEIASRSKADLFVSIHANSHPSKNVHGMEVYSSKDLDSLDKMEEQRVLNHRLLFKNLNMQDNKIVEDVVQDMLYSKKQDESKSLAQYISQKASAMIQTDNLGSKNARFFVLRNTLIPAVLVEVGFLTNVQEEKLLKTDDYRKKIGRAVATSILDYLGYE